jgi:hypothetical protein
MNSLIDITFDFRSDTPEGKDPDALSPTLRQYHKHLWSKRLPSGQSFNLDDSTRWAYLHHRSDQGEFFLSSDTMSQSYGKNSRMRSARAQIPLDELNRFRAKMYSIGNMIVFPGRRIDGNMTINQARGCNRKIGDRFDLTLECIRLHFKGYVEFFLLHDLVTDDCSAVKYFLPFGGFDEQSPYPSNVDDFKTYIQEATRFIDARNQRVLEIQSSGPQG